MANTKQAKFIVDVSAESKHTRKSAVRFFSYDKKTAEIVIQAEKDNELIPRGTISNVEIYFESVNSSYRPTDSLKWNDQMTINDDGLFFYTLTDDLLNYQGLVAFEVYINYINNDQSDSSNRIIYEQRTSAIDRAAGEIEIVYIKDMETAKKEVADKAAEVKESLAGYDSGLDIYTDQKKTEMDNFTRNVQETSINEITKIQNELPKVKQVNVDETKKIKAEYPIVEQVATTEKEKIRAVLSTVDQTASEISAYADRKISEYDAKFTQSNQKMNDLQQSQTALTTKLTETQQKITDADVFTKAESSVNVINQIGGAESAILKKELLVNGIEGTASRYVKDISSNENLLGAFKNRKWKLDSKTGRVMIEGASSGSVLSEVTLPAGNYTVSFKVFQKPTTSTSLSMYIDGIVDNSGGISNFNGFNEGVLVTKKITLTNESIIKYTLWGNANSDTISFEMKMEKGDHTKYSPAPEWFGVVHGQPNLLDGTSNEWEEFNFNSYDASPLIFQNISDMGLKVGDIITIRSEIQNLSGIEKACTKMCFYDGAALITRHLGSMIAVGSIGISTISNLPIPENTTRIGYYKVSKWAGGSDSTIKVRGHKLIKGSLTAMDEWTPSQTDSGLTIVNDGMVPFTDEEYAELLSEDGVARAETKIVGRGAEIEFSFDVIGTLEKKYPYLFKGLSTMSEKVTKYKSLLANMSITVTHRGDGLPTPETMKFRSKAYIASLGGGAWTLGSIMSQNPVFGTQSQELNQAMKDQIFSDGTYKFWVATRKNSIGDNGYISDGVTPAWVEVKDIRLVVEIEASANQIIKSEIAAYCRPLEQQINNLAQIVADMENK